MWECTCRHIGRDSRREGRNQRGGGGGETEEK